MNNIMPSGGCALAHAQHTSQRLYMIMNACNACTWQEVTAVLPSARLSHPFPRGKRESGNCGQILFWQLISLYAHTVIFSKYNTTLQPIDGLYIYSLIPPLLVAGQSLFYHIITGIMSFGLGFGFICRTSFVYEC